MTFEEWKKQAKSRTGRINVRKVTVTKKHDRYIALQDGRIFGFYHVHKDGTENIWNLGE